MDASVNILKQKNETFLKKHKKNLLKGSFAEALILMRTELMLNIGQKFLQNFELLTWPKTCIQKGNKITRTTEEC